MAPKMVEEFTGYSIDIDPEKDRTSEELLLPTPYWCKDITVTENVVLAGGFNRLQVDLNGNFDADIFYDCNV